MLHTGNFVRRGPWPGLRARTMTKGRWVSMSAPRPPKEEGSIASVFTSLTGEAAVAHPPRFAALKREIWNDGMVESWRQVLAELEVAAADVARRGSEVRFACTA